MAKFLANENVPGVAVRALRRAGYDVEWIADLSPAATDQTVLSLALVHSRVLVTFNKDFGEMTFRQGKSASCGVVLFRPRLRSPDYVAQFVVAVLGQPLNFEGSFAVAQEGKLRVIPLPD